MNKHPCIETAKRLKEVGWGKETEYCYGVEVIATGKLTDLVLSRNGFNKSEAEYQKRRYSVDILPAPDIAELLEELPWHVPCTDNQFGDLVIEFSDIPNHEIAYPYYNNGSYSAKHPKLVEALASLWVKLQEKK